MLKLIEELKQNDQDFELYPTTDEIIFELYHDIVKNNRLSYHFSILDIGAGTGKVLNKLSELVKKNRENVKLLNKQGLSYEHSELLDNFEYFSFTKYAMEKSEILIKNMPEDISIIGTDFEAQSLIDKNQSVTFCNPPYSKYEKWIVKIMKETNSDLVYFVIPKRWINTKEVFEVAEKRNYSYEIIKEFSFENAEDRKARAFVHLVRFKRPKTQYKEDDAFDFWFDENFKLDVKKASYSMDEREVTKETINNQLIDKENIIREFVKLYQRDLQNLLNNYKNLENIDQDILKELGVNKKDVKEGLKSKISGLKNLYWQSLFDRLDKITSRFTAGTRKKIFDLFCSKTNIDFTESNIYAVLVDVIKTTNKFFDIQIKNFYLELADRENIKLYKSNKIIPEDGWRYQKKDMTHFSLDYRIITSRYSVFHEYNSRVFGGLSQDCYDFLGDVLTIANNLGFKTTHTELYAKTFLPGKLYEFTYEDKNFNYETLFTVRIYKKGTLHFKFCQEFIKKLNIEAARINGWIKKPSDACNEFDIKPEEAEEMFGSLFKIEVDNHKMLLAA